MVREVKLKKINIIANNKYMKNDDKKIKVQKHGNPARNRTCVFSHAENPWKIKHFSKL